MCLHHLTRHRSERLEETPNQPGVSDCSRQLATCTRLETFDGDFKTVHLQIVDLTDEETTVLETEQNVLDRHDDEITGLANHLQKIFAKCSGPDIIANQKVSSRKLSYVEHGLKTMGEALSVVREGHDNVPLVEQHCEQLAEYNNGLQQFTRGPCDPGLGRRG